jgi:hypothetical protein
MRRKPYVIQPTGRDGIVQLRTGLDFRAPPISAIPSSAAFSRAEILANWYIEWEKLTARRKQ